ncbi:MAG: aminotransferase class I/II-fold pyridoxal phosphate-dependent enzyme [Bacteroidales bacterium]|nr:aminotransferase class I/II-fold pyridoxal phosphate-dependent enzyme [Bacteroidales bacterium]
MMNHIHFINRRNTDCYKWDSVKNNADFVPLWVADMDIATPEPIVKTIVNRAQHPAYGYVKVPKRYYDAVTQWFDTQHGWKFNNDDIIYTTGVIPAVSAVIKAVTKPGDNVILFTPVYNHFYSSIRNNECKMVSCPLVADDNNVYHIDFEAFENICKTQGGILLLCNPHNPTSRVFSPEELDKIVQICLKYNIFVISDEIHCEIVMPGFEFTPLAK